jgi:pimeloyl-ACP methyl ester carboxylesterase
MAPVAERLSARFNVLEPLQRGSGTVPLTVASHVADLHDILQEPLRIAPIRLVGFSWGALLALTYAARHPAGVDRVVAVGCGTFDVQTRRVYQARMAERMNTETQQAIDRLQNVLARETDPEKRNKLLAQFGCIYGRLQAFDPLDTDESASVSCDEQAFRETWADAVSLQENGVQPAEFSRIGVPVTMIHGESDPHPGRLIYESLRPFIARLTYTEIPHCGHKPWIERQAEDAFYAALIQCLL